MLLLIIARILLVLAGFQDQGPLMWTGKGTADAVPSQPSEKDAPKLLSEMRRNLGELKTQTDVRRDFAKQLPTLDTMRAVANWSFAYPGKAEILSEIAEVRADWLEKLGRHAEAVFAAQHPLVMPEEKGRPPYESFEWVPSSGALAPLIAEIDALPRMIQLRNRFSSAAPVAKGVDAIEDAVRKEVEHGDPRNLKNFGARCAPALAKVLLEGPEQLDPRLGWDMDPLLILLNVDRKRGLELILSSLGKRGPIWTVRVIDRLQDLGLTGDGTWTPSSDAFQPPTFNDPLALSVLDALAAHAMSSERYFKLVGPLIYNDVVTPGISAFLLGQVPDTDPAAAKLLRWALDGQAAGPNKRALYEAFLGSSDPDLRRRCARALAFYPVGPATLRACEHSDPGVRSSVPFALVRHFSPRWNYTPGSVPQNLPKAEFAVPRTPDISAALLRLAKDPASQVRIALVQALQGAREAPPDDVLGILLADPDAGVRQAAAYDWSSVPEVQARVLEALAGDTDAQVLRFVGFAFNVRCRQLHKEVTVAETELNLPAMVKWLTNPSSDMDPDPNYGPRNPLGAALTVAGGARQVFEACTRGPHKAKLAPALLQEVDWKRDRSGDPAIYEALPAPMVAELFALACAGLAPPQVDTTQRTLFDAVAQGPLDARPFIDLARDEQRSRDVRARALIIAAPKAGPGFEEALRSILVGATPAELAPNDNECREFLNRVNDICRYWPDLLRAASAWASDAQIHDGLALRVLGTANNAPAFDAAVTKACLQRWARLDEGWQRQAVNVLYHLDPHVDPGVLELWRSCYRTPALSETVVYAMARFPVDESVPLLTECVSADWMRNFGGGLDLRSVAIGALTARLDELGADALLKAIAGARSADQRAKCFEGLEQIRKYQEEKQSWQKRKGGEAAREQAIADLLPMLGDKDAGTRAAAARSLGTLKAVEHLPRLVALLKDKDASVREAAQKALDALNAPEPKKP